MKLHLQITMNEDLFLRNPEASELGKKIIKHSIQLIYKNGFEAFTRCSALRLPKLEKLRKSGTVAQGI